MHTSQKHSKHNALASLFTLAQTVSAWSGEGKHGQSVWKAVGFMWAAGALWAGLQPSLSYTNVIRYQSRPARLSHLQADQQRHTHASHTHTSVRRGRGSAACSFAVNCRGYAMLFFCSTTLWNRWSLITVWVTGSITCRFSRSYLPLLVLSHVFSLDRCRWDPQNQSAMIK